MRTREPADRHRGPGRGRQAHAGRPVDRGHGRGRGAVGRWAFPRYDADIHAELVRDALYGRLGDLGASVHGMALLFALDRRDAGPRLRDALAAHDAVLVDRYVASNAAYGAARLGQDAAGEFVAWVRALEIDRFAVPVPDHQLLLAVPREVAAQRAAHRERTEPGRGAGLVRVRRRPAAAHRSGLRPAGRRVLAVASGPRWTAAPTSTPDALAARLLG